MTSMEHLSQDEADILDNHGRDVLEWLRRNYLIYKGSWGEDITPTEKQDCIRLAIDSIHVKDMTRIKDAVDADMSPNTSKTDELHKQLVHSLRNIYGEEVIRRPINRGVLSATVFNLEDFRRTRRRSFKEDATTRKDTT